jgi:hypothetical protein
MFKLCYQYPISNLEPEREDIASRECHFAGLFGLEWNVNFAVTLAAPLPSTEPPITNSTVVFLNRFTASLATKGFIATRAS